MDTKTENLTKKNILYTLPFILVALSPIIVFGKLLEVGHEARYLWNNDIVLDYFSYYKAQSIIFSAFFCLFASLYRIIKKEVAFKLESIHIPLGIYAFMLIFSQVMSEYPNTSLFGFPERYEGLLVNLSYLIVFSTFSILIDKRKQIDITICAILLAALITGLIGLSQFLGYDILESGFVVKAISSNVLGYENLIKKGIDNLGNPTGMIYSTMYNSNTLGQYMVMMTSFSLFLMIGTKKNLHRIIMIPLIFILYGCLIGSYSRGSMIALLLVLPIYSVLVRKRINLKIRSVIYILLTSTVIFISMSLFTGGAITERLGYMLEFGTNHKEDDLIDKIKSFSIDNNLLVIKTTNQSLLIEIDDQLIFYDKIGNLLEYHMDDSTGIIYIDHKNYHDFKVQYIDEFLKVGKGKSFLMFKNYGKDILFLNPKGQVIKDYNSNYSEIGIERMGSGRGYIWTRTLPLLKNSIIVGSGVDSYAYDFPQSDYKGKLKYMYDAYIIIDKPHNIFLQIAINSGIISLISFLSLIVIWLKKSKRVINDKNEYIIKAIIPAVLAYLVSGIFTDSTVSVTPTFWLFMGIGRFYHQKSTLNNEIN